MDDLAVLTPSFQGDVDLFADLHDSVLTNTAPSVMHHVVVPPSDAKLFRQYEGTRCRVWTHRDLLPRYCLSVPYASGLTLSVRRPWPPVRGWVVQQIMKIAGTAAMDARAVLVVDSDAVLLREPTLDRFIHNGRLRHFRQDRAVTAGMDRHLVWHNVARKLLGLSGTVAPPAPDYISPIAVWDPAVARSLTEHIADSTGRSWIDAVAGELHVSEFVIYGVFVDHVLGGTPAASGTSVPQLLPPVPPRCRRCAGLRRPDAFERARSDDLLPLRHTARRAPRGFRPVLARSPRAALRSVRWTCRRSRRSGIARGVGVAWTLRCSWPSCHRSRLI